MDFENMNIWCWLIPLLTGLICGIIGYYWGKGNAKIVDNSAEIKVLEGKKDFGYDAKSDEYVDMLEAGIIDPKKVTRVALENAASVSGMILTTECALVDIKEDAPAGGGMPPMGGGMPGMM